MALGSTRPLTLVAVITAIGALVRFVGLDTQSFWLDEFLWTQTASVGPAAIMRDPDGYPPLYGLLVHFLLGSGLGSDWWLRMPSALAGVAAIPLVYAIGRRAGGPASALAAAALVALNPMAVWYSQECGAYALFMLCGLTSTLLVMRLLERPSILAASGYVTVVTVGFGLHYYFVFVVAAHALVAAADAVGHRERRRLWLGLGVAATAGFAVWGQALLYDIAEQSAEDSGRAASLLALPYTALTFVGGFSLGPPLRALHRLLHVDGSVWEVLHPYSRVTFVALAISAALGGLGFARRLTRERVLVALLILVPALGAWICSASLVGFRPRYVLPALPFVAIWCATTLETRRLRSLTLILLAALGGLEIAGLRQMNAVAYAREDTRSAARYVAERDDHGVVVLVGDAAGPFARYAAPARTVIWIAPRDLLEHDGLERVIAPAFQGGDVWLVSARSWTVDPDERVRALLDSHLVPREEASFAGVRLRLYETPAGSRSLADVARAERSAGSP